MRKISSRTIKLIRLKNRNDEVLIKNISSAVIYKGIALIISFFATPLYIALIGNQEILGGWFTILSVLQWMTILDIGIGNGLRNNIVACLQKRDKESLREYISSGYIVLGCIVLVMILTSSIVTMTFNWNIIFNVSESVISKEVLRFVIAMTLIVSLVGLELKIAMSILYALQKNALANLTTLVTNAFILLFLMVSSRSDFGDIYNFRLLAIVYSIASVLPLIVLTIYLFNTDLKDARPSIKYFDFHKSKIIVNSSLEFFIVQIGLIIVVSTNSWMITKFSGASFAVNYQVYNKIYSLAPMAFTLITQSRWSGFSAAKERNDIEWIDKKYKQIAYFAFLCILGVAVLTVLLPFIVKVWLNENAVAIETSTSIIFLFTTTMQIAMYCFTCFANGLNRIKCQVVCISLGAIIKIPVAIILLSIFNSWEMVVLSEGISLIPIALLQPIVNYMNLYQLKIKDNRS